jgi:hypothetical protein
MITLYGNFEEYCEGCPYIEIERIAQSVDGEQIFSCENLRLCNRLFRRLQNKISE